MTRGECTRTNSLTVLVVCTVLTLAACNRNPEQRAARHAVRADAYAAKQQFAEAIIEYGNALKARPADGVIRYKLGRAYEAAGDPVKAYREYAHAGDIDPSNLEAQMRAGHILLAAGEFQRARTRAELALKAAPQHVPALILLGNASAGLKDIVSALRQVEQAVALDPTSAPAWSALGAMQFSSGRDKEAGAAFQKAIEVAPRSADAHLALASYLWAKGNVTEAEGTLNRALELDGGNPAAHRALALLLLIQRRAPEAETHFRALATDSAGRLALADYYAGAGRKDESLKLLDELEADSAKAVSRAARLRKAALLYESDRKGDAHQIVDALLQERPRTVQARLAKARMLLAEKASAEAAAQVREAITVDAGNAAAHYMLGLALAARQDLAGAERAFAEVARINPRAAAAQLQLARIRLLRGESAAALSAAEAAVRARPQDVEGSVLLSQSLRATGQIDRAAREVSQRIAKSPAAAPLQVEQGWIALHRRDTAAARAAFTRALATDRRSFEARSGLIAADLAERNTARARTDLASWRTEDGADPRLRLLEARVELAAGEFASATGILTSLVAEDPSQLDAYQLLGSIYASQGKMEQAVSQYERLAAQSPAAAVGAKTMVGMLKEAQSDRAGARAVYERLVAADAQAAVAANNLAWIYAEEGKLDEALRLATIARDGMGRRPEAEDTLGWVYLKKGLASQALASFERARERAPHRAVYHYHAGLAYLQAEDRGRARVALEKALSLTTDFEGASDARARLASLQPAK